MSNSKDTIDDIVKLVEIAFKTPSDPKKRNLRQKDMAETVPQGIKTLIQDLIRKEVLRELERIASDHDGNIYVSLGKSLDDDVTLEERIDQLSKGEK